MEGTYDVKLGPEKLGTVTVTRQGLYWQFLCRCSLSGEVMYDLTIRVGEVQEKLGLLTPENGSFCLRAKLPVKRVGQGSPQFFLQPRHAQVQGLFVPVRPEEPFAYIRRLEQAYLAVQNRQIGVMLQEEK